MKNVVRLYIMISIITQSSYFNAVEIPILKLLKEKKDYIEYKLKDTNSDIDFIKAFIAHRANNEKEINKILALISATEQQLNEKEQKLILMIKEEKSKERLLKIVSEKIIQSKLKDSIKKLTSSGDEMCDNDTHMKLYWHKKLLKMQKNFAEREKEILTLVQDETSEIASDFVTNKIIDFGKLDLIINNLTNEINQEDKKTKNTHNEFDYNDYNILQEQLKQKSNEELEKELKQQEENLINWQKELTSLEEKEKNIIDKRENVCIHGTLESFFNSHHITEFSLPELKNLCIESNTEWAFNSYEICVCTKGKKGTEADFITPQDSCILLHELGHYLYYLKNNDKLPEKIILKQNFDYDLMRLEEIFADMFACSHATYDELIAFLEVFGKHKKEDEEAFKNFFEQLSNPFNFISFISDQKNKLTQFASPQKNTFITPEEKKFIKFLLTKPLLEKWDTTKYMELLWKIYDPQHPLLRQRMAIVAKYASINKDLELLDWAIHDQNNEIKQLEEDSQQKIKELDKKQKKDLEKLTQKTNTAIDPLQKQLEQLEKENTDKQKIEETKELIKAQKINFSKQQNELQQSYDNHKKFLDARIQLEEKNKDVLEQSKASLTQKQTPQLHQLQELQHDILTLSPSVTFEKIEEFLK